MSERDERTEPQLCYTIDQINLMLETAREQGARGRKNLEELLYQCVRELDYVQSVENCNSGLCASAKGKELIERGMAALGVKDLSAETLAHPGRSTTK